MAGMYDIVAGALAVARSAAGVTVTYKRNDADAPAVLTLQNVAIGKTIGQQENPASGVVVEVEYRDFLIAVSDLESGELFEPKVGHQIEQTENGQLVCYQVVKAPPDGAFRYSDPARTQFRVHTLKADRQPQA